MPLAWRSALESLLEAELRDGAPDNPFRPAVLRWAAATSRPGDPEPLLAILEQAAEGRSSRRLRWRLPVGRWIDPALLVRWRPAEIEATRRDPTAHANRLWLPAVLVDQLAWLEELAAGPDPRLAARARAIADEALPAIEDVVAGSVGGSDTWADTFLLWSFARNRPALRPLRGLVVALAARYAARAGRTAGIARGRSFPWFDVPMASSTAHLATASATLGEGMQLVDAQLAWLRAERRPDGGWGDRRQPSDILSTLAAARLFGAIDPGFNPLSVVEPLRSMVAGNGAHPCLIGPEWPWLTAELAAYLDWAAHTFTERFQWPNVADSAMDPKVGVPRYEGYLLLADLFDRVPALGRGTVDVAFVDLANFGKWNGDHGQDAGDRLLALLTHQPQTVPRSRTYRDGGDEFLVVGAPQTDDLETGLRDLCTRWPKISREAFRSMPVVPIRGVIKRVAANDLREGRATLGLAIGPLKRRHPEPDPEGVIEALR
jgi:GGDEF domain-containing protein